MKFCKGKRIELIFILAIISPTFIHLFIHTIHPDSRARVICIVFTPTLVAGRFFDAVPPLSSDDYRIADR